MDNFQNAEAELLYVDEAGKNHLLETVKWSKFIAIVMFVAMGLMILGGLFMGMFGSMISKYGAEENTQLMGGIAPGLLMVIYIMIALLYFFPSFYLYKFSTLIKHSILFNNKQQFNEALNYQRKMYRFVGILMIVKILLYALLFLFVGLIGLVAA